MGIGDVRERDNAAPACCRENVTSRHPPHGDAFELAGRAVLAAEINLMGRPVGGLFFVDQRNPPCPSA